MKLLLNLILLLFLIFPLMANDLEKAAQLAQKGNYVGAIDLYNQILNNSSTNIEALKGRAYVYSWSKNYNQAIDDFHKILEIEPDNEEALTGLGYAHAWSGKYKEADEYFKQAIQINPDLESANKGRAFTALWKNKNKEAISRFLYLSTMYPNDAETQLGLGYAFLNQGNLSQARKSLENAYNLNPAYKDVPAQINSIQKMPGLAELSLWGGYSSIEGENAIGLRSLRLSANGSKAIKFYLNYDNSLSLDNRFLQNTNQNIATFSGGGIFSLSPQWLSRIELGYRDLKQEIGNQYLYQLETVYVFKSGYSFKTGGLVGPRDDRRTEWFGYAGGGFPLSEKLSMESLYYFGGLTGQNETTQRFQLNAAYNFTQLTDIVAGVAGGSQNYKSAHLLLNMPLGSLHWWQIVMRYESTKRENIFTTALGLRLRLEN